MLVRVGLPLLAVAVAFWVYSIVDCTIQPSIRHRGVRKGTWVLIVIVLPVLGGILWFAVGRVRKSHLERPAPDDDPTFLGRLSDISDQDERIRRLEEELAQLAAEEDAAPSPSADAAPPAEEGTGGDVDDADDDQGGAEGDAARPNG